MKILPLEFESKGFGYKQIVRENMFAVYAQYWGGLKGRLIAYETIIIKYHDDYTMGGVTIPAGESYPGTNSWGKLGFTFSISDPNAKRKALDKMRQVMQDEEMKAKKRAEKAAQATQSSEL